jgi:dTDP-4-dehydrorhamnose 3,5-epimerase
MFDIRRTEIDGFLELQAFPTADSRGAFVKTFHRDFFASNGLAANLAEQYYSRSRRGVLRGLHFQLPPYDHAKLVYCVVGEIVDVAVDLRIDSPTYGRHAKFTISADCANQAFLDNGLAHGFYVVSDMAIVVYNVTSVHSPEHDGGIRWDSAEIRWPDEKPLLSARDTALPRLSEFQSPFRMKAPG